jgi:signal transduction histidine kinase
VVKVLDRGPGIPEAELDKVLQPFYRIEGSRNPVTGGTGLGLAIVQRLLPHCRAQLHLAAREGGGLQASIRIS